MCGENILATYMSLLRNSFHMQHFPVWNDQVWSNKTLHGVYYYIHPIFVSTKNQHFYEERNLLMESNLMNFNNFSVEGWLYE